MKGIGARLRGDVHLAASGYAELRVGGCRLHLELLNGIDRREDNDTPDARLHVVDAVEEEIG